MTNEIVFIDIETFDILHEYINDDEMFDNLHDYIENYWKMFHYFFTK